MFEAWAKEYGVAYEVPMTLGGKQIVLTDSRALAHYYARETWVYVQTNSTRSFLQRNFGRGIVWSEGEAHRRKATQVVGAIVQPGSHKEPHLYLLRIRSQSEICVGS
ncbi:hypothetical protein PISMIDRAFT_327266 [Pisolithus microcarpus 441]|uniref:Cytochrome P450 n=1 Tax=Pisolithus microcarpus 441 TaxID=765257 RepID=A0A0C9ZIU6_9AGAM|nr:hypothetical protein PISMIDRAFT_327266 [Pisolithus microcarpus 441]